MIHNGLNRDQMIPVKGGEATFWRKITSAIEAVKPPVKRPPRRVIMISPSCSSENEDDKEVNQASVTIAEDGSGPQFSTSSTICAICNETASVIPFILKTYHYSSCDVVRCNTFRDSLTAFPA